MLTFLLQMYLFKGAHRLGQLSVSDREHIETLAGWQVGVYCFIAMFLWPITYRG